jgi:hypothetical protein
MSKHIRTRTAVHDRGWTTQDHPIADSGPCRGHRCDDCPECRGGTCCGTLARPIHRDGNPGAPRARDRRASGGRVILELTLASAIDRKPPGSGSDTRLAMLSIDAITSIERFRHEEDDDVARVTLKDGRVLWALESYSTIRELFTGRLGSSTTTRSTAEPGIDG